MKKFTILTSVLALTACGGGSGGPGAPVRVTPNEGFLSATPEAVESNQQITDMVSEIDVCTENCESPRQDTARVSTKEINGKKFTIYDLNDVDFVFAEEGFGGKLEFKVDPTTKQITHIIFDEDDENPLERNTTDNKFHGTIEHGDAALTYSSVAKREKLGLRYSDFGNFEVQGDHIGAAPDHKIVGAFIGGYDIKRIDPNTIHTAMTFNGRAVGGVETLPNGQGSGKSLTLDTSTNANANDKIATLTFDNGTSTLNAKFDNWYDVKHVKSSTDEYIEFSNFTNGAEDANDFRMISNTAIPLRNHQYTEYEEAQSTGEIGNSLNSDIRYYGDNGAPREAVGLVQIVDRGTEDSYYDQQGGDFNENQIRMNLSFGGTIVNQ